MAFWEFLIQKEGDRSWLPLESPTVEVLEGRYRMVARASRVNTPVEIRVVHRASAEVPPVRRIQKRTSQTNQDGLVVMIPFTRLLPGDWEISCTADLMSDMLGNGWRYAVQLQVQPLDTLEAEDWDSDWELPNDELTAPAVSAMDPEPADHAPVLVAAHLDEPLGQSPDESLGQSLETKADPGVAASMQLTLARESYMVQRGQPLILTGQIEGLGQSESLGKPLTAIAPLQLRVRLLDPQTSQTLVDETQALNSLPAFSMSVALPANSETHLILGELALSQVIEGEPSVLATQSFSVTTDLLELLETIANDFPEATEPDPPVASFLNLPRTIPPVQFRLAIPQPLPPQLRSVAQSPDQPDENKERRSLELPTFSAASTAIAEPGHLESVASESADESIESESTGPDAEFKSAGSEATGAEAREFEKVQPLESASAAEIEIPALSETAELTSDLQAATRDDRPAIPNGAFPEPEGAELAQPQQPVEILDPSVDWEADRPRSLWQQPAEVNLSSAPVDVAFRSLNLRDRFLERLQALASDEELLEWLNSLESEAKDPQTTFAQTPDRPTNLDAELTSQEIVVEDEPPLPSPEPDPKAIALAEDPLATPQLEIPAGELVSGQTVTIKVKIPSLDGRVYIKLWMHDRQSRTLLDGPHWLMDFGPDGLGSLVAKTQVMVPFGCLEVQFEAIAIDMISQRESDKVSLIRDVVPPDLMAVAVGELGV